MKKKNVSKIYDFVGKTVFNTKRYGDGFSKT